MIKMLYITRDVILEPIEVNSPLLENKFNKLFSIDDPLDRLIVDSVEKGELKVGFVEVKPNRWLYLKKYLPSIVKH